MKQLAVDLVILNERQSSYVQDLQIAIETLVRTSQSAPQPGGIGSAGRVFVLRADLIPAETRALLTSVGASRARRRTVAGLFDQLERIVEPAESRRAAPQRDARAFRRRRRSPVRPSSNSSTGSAASRETARNTSPSSGRANRRRRPGSMSSPIRPSASRPDRRRRLHLVRQQPREPAHAMVERSRSPTAPGEAFYLRDDDTGACGARPRFPSATRRRTYIARHGRGYSRFEHDAHGIAADLAAIRADRRFDQDFAPDAAQQVEPRAAAQRDRLCRMGSRPVAFGVAAVRHQPRSMPPPARCSPEIPGASALARASPLPTCAGRRRLDRRPARVYRAATARWPTRRRSPARRRCRRRVGAGLDPCGAMRATIELPPGGGVEVVFFLGEAASADEARGADRALSRRRSRRRAVAASTRLLGRHCSARSR